MTALTLHADVAHLVGNAIACVVLITAVAWSLGPGVGTWLVLLAGAGGNALRALAHEALRLVGASTAIFGALGILAMLQIAARRQRRRRGARRGWSRCQPRAPQHARDRSAVGRAHPFLGLLVGGLLAIGPALALRRPPGRLSQWLLALTAGGVVLGCWWIALVDVG